MPDNDTTGWPRDVRGRLISRRCPDPNCGGTLRAEADDCGTWWRCDGLTYETETGPLTACNHAVPPIAVARALPPTGRLSV